MREQNSPSGIAGSNRRIDKGARTQRQYLCPHDPREDRRVEEADHHDDVEKRLARRGHDGQRQHDGRKGPQQVEDAQQDFVQHAARITRDQPKGDADQNRDCRGRYGDCEGKTGAVDGPRQDVHTIAIRPQQELAAGR